MAQHLADLHGDRIALVDWKTRAATTFTQLAQQAAGLSARLHKRGVGRGDRVALLATNRVEAVALLLACNRLGATLVPLNWRLAAVEVAALLQDCEPRLVLTEAHLAALAGKPVVDLVGLLAEPAVSAPPPANVAPEDAAFILYTGGTTGLPKGAVLPWRAVLANARNTVNGWGLGRDDVTPLLFPLFHTGGWNVLTLPLLLLGGRTVVMGGFDPAATLDAVARERCTLVIGVPTMFHAMLDDPSFARRDLSSVREFVSGGAPCPQSVVAAFQRRGAAFRLGYGLTEAGPNNFRSTLPTTRAKPQSVGRAMPGVAIRIVRPDLTLCAAGEPGELQLRGDHCFAGYWRRSEASRDAFTADGWLRTGDVAVADVDGDVAIVDRLKDMFISGGENVHPVEVEAALLRHPAVAMAAVVGVPDDTWGEVGHAFIVARPGQVVATADLLQHARGQLGRYKVPRYVTVLDALPLSAAGKVLKTELRRRAVAAEAG